MHRLKLPGQRPMARDLDPRTAGTHIRAAVLDRFARPGTPETTRVAWR